jgi:putative ABC transport system substrate-binding protein
LSSFSAQSNGIPTFC